MSREALATAVQQLPLLNDRLHLAAEEALELVADDPELVHLEQRHVGRGQQALTPPMPPDRLLTLLDGMGLALDLDRRLAPSRSLFRPPAPLQPSGETPGSGPARAAAAGVALTAIGTLSPATAEIVRQRPAGAVGEAVFATAPAVAAPVLLS